VYIDHWQQITILILLLICSAFFSLAEISLAKLSKLRIRNMQNEGIKSAKIIQKIVENPNKLTSTILIGNSIVTISASTLAASIAMDSFGDNNIALGITTAVLTVIVLIFCEITPKIIAQQNAEKVSAIVAGPIRFCLWLFSPIAVVLGVITNFLVKIMGGGESNDEPDVTEAYIKTMVDVSVEEGVLKGDEQEMINNVVNFDDFVARGVMTPRMDIIAVSVDAAPLEIEEVFDYERFSRLPVYKETTDNVVGILYLKDFVFWDKDKPFNIESCMREPFFTYETKPTRDLFAVMRNESIHMAVVLDEYGCTSGLVTMEDLIEEIVGEIYDEDDDDELDIENISDTEFFVLGETRIDEVNEAIKTDIQPGDFESIGGYVLGQMGRIPEKDDKVDINGFTFVVWEIDKHRIEKLKIIKNIDESEVTHE